jgi:CubicO group peptidase (beta-lactamase class C family)
MSCHKHSFALTVLLLGWFVASAPAAEPPSTIDQRIAAVENGLLPSVRIKGRTAKTKLAERMKSRHVPAVSVAVINNYQIEWAKAYGVADADSLTPATTDTLFQAASVSKPISALASLRLVQDGVLDLDRNVNEQLTSWKVPDNKYTAEHAVDLRGLLSHTAGLTVHGFPGYKMGDSLPTVPEILDGKKPANTQPVRVNKVPGHGFRYAGGGTTVAQLLVMDVTGRPFGEFARETVLVPLGMTASSYQQPIGDASKPQAASGHDAKEKPIDGRYRVHPELAAAGLWTTPSDVARYVIEIQLAHERRSAKVLKHELVETMLAPQGGGPVGLGPFLHNRNGGRGFAHGGQNLGFNCQFIGFLDCGQGAVVMTNSDVGGPLVAEVLNAIADVYGWPGYLPPEREAVEVSSDMLEHYPGKYDLGAAGALAVRREDDRLLARSPLAGPETELYFETPLRFFSDNPGLNGQFVIDPQGAVVEAVVQSNGRESHLKRLDK